MPRPAEAFLPDDSEAGLARESRRKLAKEIGSSEGTIRVRVQPEGSGEPAIVLPRIALQLLMQILTEMGKGNAVTVVPQHAELTTQQAADMLHFSRPYLIKLLEAGELPFHKVGTHRRILFRNLKEYREKTKTAREEALSELASLSQELGLHETDSRK